MTGQIERRQAFVTGASGFVGRNVISALAMKGWLVRSFSRKDAMNAKMSSSVKPVVKEIAKNAPIDVVFHLAGRINGSLTEIEQDNVEFTRSVISATCALSTKPKLVYLSSVS